MKKILTLLFALCIIFPSLKAFAVEDIVSLDEVKQEEVSAEQKETEVPANTLQAAVTFDWLDISQAQRDENIEHYSTIIIVGFSKDICNFLICKTGKSESLGI